MVRENSQRIDKDALATELYSEILKTYPENCDGKHYAHDSRYIALILLRHLRLTCLRNRSLSRNSSFFKSFVSNTRISNRVYWLKAMKEGISHFFPSSKPTKRRSL